MVSPSQQQGPGENGHKFVGGIPMYRAVVSPGQAAVEPESAERPSDHQHYAPIESYGAADDLQKNTPTAPISDRSESDFGIK